MTGQDPVRVLAAAIKARWSCEQAHQQLKEELGADHFERRTWSGLHHQTLLTPISFAFLQPCAFGSSGGGKETRPQRRGPPQPTLPAMRRPLLAHAQASFICDARNAAAVDLPAARVSLDVAM